MRRRGGDGRAFAPSVPALRGARDGASVALRAPSPGFFRRGPALGAFLEPGDALGELEVLGAVVRIEVPAGAAGVVVEVSGDAGLARRPVGYGDPLVVLDPSAAPAGVAVASAPSAGGPSFAGLALRAPSSGRFYARPSPGEAPFVKAGEVVGPGQTVALLEVMKTFNRVAYGGAGLPERARVVRVVPADESDVLEGDVLLELEPATGEG